MHFVYILFSPSLDKYYIGESMDPGERLFQHNTSFFSKSSTRIAQDWQIVLTIGIANRLEARKIEQYIKGMKSKKFLNSLCHDKMFYEKFRELVLEKFSINILK